MKAQKKGLVFAVVLRIIGIFILMQGFRMIGEGVYNYINEHSQQDWITVSAEVVDVRSEYSGSFTEVISTMILPINMRSMEKHTPVSCITGAFLWDLAIGFR